MEKVSTHFQDLLLIIMIIYKNILYFSFWVNVVFPSQFFSPNGDGINDSDDEYLSSDNENSLDESSF